MKQVQISHPVDSNDRTGGSGWNVALDVICQNEEVASVVDAVREICESRDQPVQIVIVDAPEGAVAMTDISDRLADYEAE